MPLKPSALIFGSTGLVGSHLVRELGSLLMFDAITAPIRGGGHLPEDTPPGTQFPLIDFGNLESAKPYFKATHCFCCLGTTRKKAGSKEAFVRVDRDYVLQIARLVHSQGCEFFSVVTALGADPASSVFYNRIKGQVEHELRSIPFRGVAVFRPSLLVGHRKEFRPAEELAALLGEALTPFFQGRLRHLRPTPAQSVAKAMAQVALRSPEGFHVFGPEEIRRLSDGRL